MESLARHLQLLISPIKVLIAVLVKSHEPPSNRPTTLPLPIARVVRIARAYSATKVKTLGLGFGLSSACEAGGGVRAEGPLADGTLLHHSAQPSKPQTQPLHRATPESQIESGWLTTTGVQAVTDSTLRSWQEPRTCSASRAPRLRQSTGLGVALVLTQSWPQD